MHDSVTANKNQYKKLKMEKYSWPVRATSRDVEGYAQPEEPYEKTSAFTILTTSAGKEGCGVCMASFGSLAICLQCEQMLLADANLHFGYTEITFDVCRVDKSAVFTLGSDASDCDTDRKNHSLKLKMCINGHNDEIKLTFTWHWEYKSVANMQTLHECVVSVEELAKMTYLSPCIEVPKDLESDVDTATTLKALYPRYPSSFLRLMQSRKENMQAHISFVGPLTLTYAAALSKQVAGTPPDKEHYYVCSVKTHVISGITQPLQLKDGMTILRPVSDETSGLDPNAAEERKRNLIKFDNDITTWLASNKDQDSEAKAKTIASLPKGSKIQENGDYEIPAPNELGARPPPGERKAMSHGLPHGLVFYDEMNLCSIPACPHQVWP